MGFGDHAANLLGFLVALGILDDPKNSCPALLCFCAVAQAAHSRPAEEPRGVLPLGGPVEIEVAGEAEALGFLQ